MMLHDSSVFFFLACRNEGAMALFKGASARIAFHAPSTAITMSLFESCRHVFAALLDE